MSKVDDGEQDESHRQYLWLIRYGRTYPGLIENVGNYDSDLHDPEGYDHAKAMANRMISSQIMPNHVYSDPFLRCIRTAHTLVQTLSSQREVSIKVEEGVTEWQVPSLLVNHETGTHTSPRTVKQLQSILSSNTTTAAAIDHFIDESYQSINPQGPRRDDGDDDNDDVRPRFPETEYQLHQRCRTTVERIIQQNNSSTSDNNIAIVSHAPCLQSMAMALEGVSSPEESSVVGPWSLGGLTLFSRSKQEEKWTLEYYSDTSHMPPGEYQDGSIGKWSLPSFERE